MALILARSGASLWVFTHLIRRTSMLGCSFTILRRNRCKSLKVSLDASLMYKSTMLQDTRAAFSLSVRRRQLSLTSKKFTLWKSEILLQDNRNLSVVLKFKCHLM
jgi:hypothetical protein